MARGTAVEVCRPSGRGRPISDTHVTEFVSTKPTVGDSRSRRTKRSNALSVLTGRLDPSVETYIAGLCRSQWAVKRR